MVIYYSKTEVCTYFSMTDRAWAQVRIEAESYRKTTEFYSFSATGPLDPGADKASGKKGKTKTKTK